jgi:hypothetical protein
MDFGNRVGGTSGTQYGSMSTGGGGGVSNNWQSQSVGDSSRGYASTPLKFNPLQGTGNTEVFIFNNPRLF